MLPNVFRYTSVLILCHDHGPYLLALADYDAVSLAPTASAPTDFHQTVFPISSDGIIAAAEQLAEKRREKRAFTVR